MPKQKLTEHQQQELNEANDAVKCQAFVILEHGAFLTVIATAIEQARLHPHVPPVVAAHYSFEEAEEMGTVRHMVGVISITPAPASAPVAEFPADLTVQ